MTIWAYAMLSVFLVSLISLVGLAAFAINARMLERLVFLSVGFAAGALYGDAFFHLIPESFERLPQQVSSYLLVGILTFFALEKILRWQHSHSPPTVKLFKPVGYLNLFSDGVHNFIDGILIGSSYLVSVRLGLATTVAVLLHEIPQEIGDFGVLLSSGFSKARALLFNFLTACCAILGAVAALLLGDLTSGFSELMLPVAAGGFIYIAGSDLIPELQQEVGLSKSLAQLAAIVAGAALMMLIP